jgi:hypothetical protein
MYGTVEEAQACPTGDIDLVEDLQSGLVCNAAFRPELMQYDKHYQNEQAVSGSFRDHLAAVCDIVGRTLGKQHIVEVGCGKGYFLNLLHGMGVDATGFDPTYEGDDPRVKKCYFGPDVGMTARGIVLRHVLEHIQDPFTFLTQLKEANRGQGRIYIEVPCLEWIIRRRAWFDIFYEHVNYFRQCDFNRLFGTIVETGHLFGGQYLYVVAELASLRKPQFDAKQAIDFPADFTAGIVDRRQYTDRKHAAIWGGASKGVIFALLKARAGMPIDTVIDINPAKQNRFLALSGLRVQSPQEALASLPRGSIIYVMNTNYMDEIRQMAGEGFTYIGVDHE